MIGASGAIAATLGAYLVLFPGARIPVARVPRLLLPAHRRPGRDRAGLLVPAPGDRRARLARRLERGREPTSRSSPTSAGSSRARSSPSSRSRPASTAGPPVELPGHGRRRCRRDRDGRRQRPRAHAARGATCVVLPARPAAAGCLMIWVGCQRGERDRDEASRASPRSGRSPTTSCVNVLEAMSIRVEKIVISDLAEETYHARIVLVGPDAPARGGLAALGRDRARRAPGVDDLRHGGRARPAPLRHPTPRTTRRATSPVPRPGACRRRRSRRPASRSMPHASTSSASS